MSSVLEKFDIRGRSAIVTGAGSGLGLAHAEALAEAGAQVTLADINIDSVNREVDRLAQQGWTVVAASVDVSDESSVAAMVAKHVEKFGGLDIAFANAGVGIGAGWMGAEGDRPAEGQIDTLDMEVWKKTFSINLEGAINTVRHCAGAMKARGRGGSIVVTTSNASTITVPVISTAYMVSKAGLAHFVRNVAFELADFNIRVNAIAPGSFVTNIGGGVAKNPAMREVWDKSVPLGKKMAEIEQMKPLSLYLASDASSYMTGAELVIDGGVALRSGF